MPRFWVIRCHFVYQIFKLSLSWPTIASDVQKACESCHQCQKKRRVAVCDRVSVIPIKKDKVTASKVPVDLQDRENSELVQDNQNTQDYATAHTEKAQQRYISRYNLRAREKSFEIGQKVLVLIPDLTKFQDIRLPCIFTVYS